MSGVELDSSSDALFKQPMRSRRVVQIVILVAALVLGLAIGLLVGTFAIGQEQDGLYLSGVPAGLVSDADPAIAQKIIDGIQASRIEENLRLLSQKPHIAGRENDMELVELLKSRFRSAGLAVQTTPYDVLLSYPDLQSPNSVRLINASNHIIYDAKSDDSDISALRDVVPPFHAYSPSSLVQGNIVFVGYGRDEDYQVLREHNVTVTGNLVLVKYGKIFRGDKVDIANKHGATGVIMFSDPADYTGMKSGDPRVYPDTWWLPPSGSQRGTVFTGDGDPLTPGHPANNLAYRYPQDKVKPPLPKIPSHPIGYGAAIHIIKSMSGPRAPSSWQGGLNVTYHLGPTFIHSGWKIELNVTSKNERAKADNVFGIIRGFVEPDRYVLIGNHRDAWIYGAIDPSSGTAVMLEVARVMGALVQSGQWRPRRSIVFCSWGAEEFGLIGSTEWVEQYVATLRERAVAYVNIDIAVDGNDTIKVAATPLMRNVVMDACKKVPNPNPNEVKAGRRSIYDTWVHVTPDLDDNNKTTGRPVMSSLASGSDFAPLLQRAGITAADATYTFDKKRYSVSSYALYHTEYETFQIVKDQFDREFKFHAAMAQFGAEMVRSLADPLILPMNVTNYATGLEELRVILHKEYGELLSSNLGDSYDLLETVIRNFSVDVSTFENNLQKVNKKNPLAVRAVNDQIMLLERAFLEPEGLPNRPYKKHLIFAENSNDAYAGSSFPGLVDLLFEVNNSTERWDQVRQHFAVILQVIQSAGATLRDVTGFMDEYL
ncbi:putative N-acetylated-alpha-linked acidic dipeptidase [Physella acuta]|uniref:putative N-acetylated-alpha-linked acidic dipeptidase n=1 Tax=Physella acuta TaxID=109671 RepID=UPI0027DDB3AE|nr:putative N-acetylated-alpha-linked acidic dipeptidase [Physella acuta]XP_059147925.1 putative N-acetylated-alpha-linked acidic dipeptidase [Physella acuta]XP_059147926.1 putative N-acetylated-alpha-linked acidic dipeptidase [Physella acuta]XP_059147928.1 putative N-acetylated-alpha-linked acidic dipeptidase [Physella acuta]XP_059147929.1 putative N-acetylated-alpha-linked acidic dipeptidase [Physella acuta]XP_059147930.1 putative N-acetylated-alpha-linked acidic dipeptidase [Physella acuta]